MAASLNLFFDMIVDDPMQCKDLVPSFVSVLKQVIERRLPKDFDYHKVPAPWLQIKLLKILSLLGKDDRAASENMYEVLRDCLRRADIQSSAAYAVLYQCVLTCTQIYPSSQLVELAAKSVGRFLRTDNNNLKYLGITALASVVSVNPSYASPHKALVIECLDDPDETLKRKTLDLLCKMTSPANVKVIVEKLLGYVDLLWIFVCALVFFFSFFFFFFSVSFSGAFEALGLGIFPFEAFLFLHFGSPHQPRCQNCRQDQKHDMVAV